MTEHDYEGALRAQKDGILALANAGHTYKCSWEDNSSPHYDEECGYNPDFKCTCGADSLNTENMSKTILFALKFTQMMMQEPTEEMYDAGDAHITKAWAKGTMADADLLFKAMRDVAARACDE